MHFDISSFLDFIKDRKSMRSFTKDSIDDQILLQIIEAGRWAPSVDNSQPWEFIIIKNKQTILKLSNSAEHAKDLHEAPVLIAVVKNMIHEKEWLAKQLAYEQSVSCAGMLMLLAIHELGLGAYWVNVERSTNNELLNLPNRYDIAYILALGYVDTLKEARLFHKSPDEHRRKNILDVTHLDKFNQPLTLN